MAKCDDTDINPEGQTCLETYPTDPIIWCKPCQDAAKEATPSAEE